MICTVPGCDSPSRTRGWCAKHYARWFRTGSTDLPEKAEKICRVNSCVTPALAKSLCPKHYQRWKVSGDPEVIFIPHAGCDIEGCDKPHAARGLCRMHWKRQQKGQDMTAPARYQNRPTTEAERKEHKQSRGHARRASTRGAAVTASMVVDAYGAVCHICGEAIDLDAPRRPHDGEGWQIGLQIDHVEPISVGGEHTLENCRPSHAVCNLRKGIQILEKYLDMV